MEKRKIFLKEAIVLLIVLVMALSAVVVAQNQPNKPDTPLGPIVGITNIDYTFCASTTDPDEDLIYYQFDWDDGTLSAWLGPYPSGNVAYTSHTWSTADTTYCIKVIARDETGDCSEWSDPLCVNIVGDCTKDYVIAAITAIWNYIDTFDYDDPIFRDPDPDTGSKSDFYKDLMDDGIGDNGVLEKINHLPDPLYGAAGNNLGTLQNHLNGHGDDDYITDSTVRDFLYSWIEQVKRCLGDLVAG